MSVTPQAVNVNTPVERVYQTKNVMIAQTYTKHDNTHFGFNVGLHVFDEPKQVLTNRAKLLSALSAMSDGAITQLRWANQVHGNAVAFCDDMLGAKLPIADALITVKSGVGLSIMTADCVPIAIFTADGSGAIACIHAGTKGLACGVIRQTVDAMNEVNGDSSASLSPKIAYIGACISRAHYELPVSMAMDVIQTCRHKGLIDDDEGLVALQGDKALLDVVLLAKAQLQKLGIEVIGDAPCTYQNAKYHSHRRATHQERISTGRMALVIAKLS